MPTSTSIFILRVSIPERDGRAIAIMVCDEANVNIDHPIDASGLLLLLDPGQTFTNLIT